MPLLGQRCHRSVPLQQKSRAACDKPFQQLALRDPGIDLSTIETQFIALTTVLKQPMEVSTLTKR